MTYVCITNPQATICKPLCWIISLSKVYYALCWNSVQNPTANNNPRPANKQFGWPKSVDQCNRPKEQWTDNKATNSNSKTNSKNSKMLTSSTWLQDLKNWIRGRSVEHKKEKVMRCHVRVTWLPQSNKQQTTQKAKKKYTYPNFCVWKNNKQSTNCHTKFFVLQVYMFVDIHKFEFTSAATRRKQKRNNKARITKARTSVHMHGTSICLQSTVMILGGDEGRWGAGG